MRKLILLLLLAGVVLGGDVYARRYAEGRIADRIDEEVPGDRRPDVEISSFPFLGRLLAQGQAGDLRASMDLVRTERVRFTNVHVRLKGVEVDRDLLSQREVHVTGIDSGVITADLTTDALQDALGVPFRIRGGVVELTIGGQTVQAQASVTDNVLRFAVGPLPAVSLTVPKTALVPCAADASIVDDRIRLSCRLEEVPPILTQVRNGPVPAGSS